MARFFVARFFAALAQRAAATPELPWLFFRRDLDWRWRSHRQVADHLARGAAALREVPGTQVTALPVVGVEALTALFATLAAGKDFVALEAAGPETPLATPADAKWPDLVPESWQGPVVALPACHGNVDRYTPTPLPEGPHGRLISAAGSFTVEQLEARAAALAATLFAADEPPGKKVVHAGARLAAEDAAALWIAAFFAPGTALALEPYPPATLESALWCRPTHFVAHGGEVAQLAASYDGKKPRLGRLRRVVVAGGALDPAAAAQLGVPVHAFDPA